MKSDLIDQMNTTVPWSKSLMSLTATTPITLSTLLFWGAPERHPPICASGKPAGAAPVPLFIGEPIIGGKTQSVGRHIAAVDTPAREKNQGLLLVLRPFLDAPPPNNTHQKKRDHKIKVRLWAMSKPQAKDPFQPRLGRLG